MVRDLADEERDIDLLGIVLLLKERLFVIILVGLLGFSVVAAYSRFFIPAKYASTSQLYILNKEATMTSLADLQIGSQLTKDYKVIIVSRPVLQEVVDKLSLSISYKELKSRLIIENPIDTRVLSISIHDTDPVLAKTIVDEVSVTASNYIADIMEMVPPKIIETGEVETVKVSPNYIKNGILGAMLGVFVICCLSVLQVVMNDNIMTEADVEKYLGLSVLANVPDRSVSAEIKKKGWFGK